MGIAHLLCFGLPVTAVSPLFDEDALGINDCERGRQPAPSSEEVLAETRELIKKYSA